MAIVYIDKVVVHSITIPVQEKTQACIHIWMRINEKEKAAKQTQDTESQQPVVLTAEGRSVANVLISIAVHLRETDLA